MTDTRQELCLRLEGTDRFDRREAIYLLGELGDRRATLPLLAALERARAAADTVDLEFLCRALSQLRDGRARAALCDVARTATLGAAYWSVDALGRIGGEEAVATLRVLVANQAVRRVAVRALRRIGRPAPSRGRIASFHPERGFGFVRDTEGDSRFFHVRDFDAEGVPRRGEHVTFFPFARQGRGSAAGVRPAPRIRAVSADARVHGTPATGTVRWYDAALGHGFVRDVELGADVLVRAQDLVRASPRAPRPVLFSRARVRYVRVATPRGHRAACVTVEVEPGAGPTG
ncbi:MAG: cold shock domain-containing protein [Myxococcales bacterium]|nr:cold shock domain-containing protein [Myxococcales bacterium]